MFHRLLAAPLLLLTLNTPVSAGEAEIRQAVQSLSPGTKATQITAASIKGWFEVVVETEQGLQILYAEDKGQFLLVGDLLDTKARKNLTRERMDKLTAVKWESLPLDNAIKVVRGNGKRKLAVFSDPDCPYCKKAEQEFVKLDNVTIYTFLYPLAMHGDAPRKSRLVWCAKDRSQAWLDLMLKGKLPEGKPTCKDPVDDNLALGAKLRIEGTPALILANGKRIPGYAPAEKLSAMLDAAER